MSGAFWRMETTGSGQYLHHLLRALTDLHSGDEYVLCLLGYTGRATGVDFPWPIQPLRTPFDKLDENLTKLWYEQITFPRACRRLTLDLAHVPYFAPPLYPSIPTVVTIHDLIPLILPTYQGSKLVQSYTRLVSRAARKATLILTDSYASARDIQRLLGIPQERVRVIYLAAGSQYHPMSPEERQATLARLRIPSPYLLYLGGFDQRKNVTGLVQAYALAQQQLDKVRLVIAGRLPETHTEFTPDPRIVAEQVGIGNRIHYTGWVAEEDKPALYAGALGFVFPSDYEGFGLPVLEAISCGTSAIVGGGSSLEEIAGPGGIMVPPGNNRSLADALVELVQNSSLRRGLAEAGLEHARSFSWRKTAQQTLEAYQHALAIG